MLELTAGQLSNVIKKRAGAVFDVVGNGTCWLYATLGALHCLEHAWAPLGPYDESGTASAKKPTPRDVRLSQVLLECMQAHFKTLPIPDKRLANGDTLKDFEQLRGEMELLNVWVPQMGAEYAVFGNEKQLYLLAHTLERHIIVLHGPTMAWLGNKRHAESTVIGRAPRHTFHNQNSKSLRPSVITEVRALQVLEAYPDTLVLQHTDDCHYMCLQRPSSDVLDLAHLPKPLADVLSKGTLP